MGLLNRDQEYRDRLSPDFQVMKCRQDMTPNGVKCQKRIDSFTQPSKLLAVDLERQQGGSSEPRLSLPACAITTVLYHQAAVLHNLDPSTSKCFGDRVISYS